MVAGNVLICEEPWPGGTQRYGGRPVRLLHSGTPPVLEEGSHIDPNPSEANPTVGAWHYASGAILHTLNDFTYDEVDPVAHYDLDRVLMSGGSQEQWDADFDPVPPQPFTLEWNHGTWITKSPAPTPRVYGNWAVLPDRRLLAVGGTNSSSENPASATFHADAELFDPGWPLGPGSWKEVKDRPNFSTGMPPAPRGYHHVAMLLQDGRVAVMGGKLPSGNMTRSDGTVEVYKPPYTFEVARPRITSTAAQDIQYGLPFCITVDDPNRVDYAVLIGIGSVTHHFDYGQRYVELMTTLDVTGCTGNVKVLAPPLKGMAPEGYYLLFVVEQRGNTRIPSKGIFVRLF